MWMSRNAACWVSGTREKGMPAAPFCTVHGSRRSIIRSAMSDGAHSSAVFDGSLVAM